jgi:hypothetical protein
MRRNRDPVPGEPCEKDNNESDEEGEGEEEPPILSPALPVADQNKESVGSKGRHEMPAMPVMPANAALWRLRHGEPKGDVEKGVELHV